MKLLVVKPSSLGDILHTFPAIAEIHAALPEAEVSWVANVSLAPIVRLYSPLARVIPFPREALRTFSIGPLRTFLHELRQDEYDAVLDFQGLLRSGVMTWLVHTKVRFGFANAREGAPFAYNHAVRLPQELHHAADKNRYLAREFLHSLGVAPASEPPEPTLVLPAEWEAKAEAVLTEHGLTGRPLLAVGCASRWESKSWAPEFFAEALRLVCQQCPGTRIWLLGSQEERTRAQEVCACAKLEGIVNLAGKTDLGTLAAMLARSQVLFTNDSGPMHIAAALKVPCVANFGATDPEKTGPYGPSGRHYVVRSHCPKAPCFRRECPMHDRLACSRQASAEEAAQAILERII
ncbi:MAG: glycosyltransferase family 9 protein [Victivallales bacterium]|nr:glycosyltransferase family 9 protein [Victivallales bacterium]